MGEVWKKKKKKLGCENFFCCWRGHILSFVVEMLSIIAKDKKRPSHLPPPPPILILDAHITSFASPTAPRK
jgi:hypothetical protein